MFSRTLEHGNCKNEKTTEEDVTKRRVNLERITEAKKNSPDVVPVALAYYPPAWVSTRVSGFKQFCLSRDPVILRDFFFLIKPPEFNI